MPSTILFVEGSDDAVFLAELMQLGKFKRLEQPSAWGPFARLGGARSSRATSTERLMRETTPSVFSRGESLVAVQPCGGKESIATVYGATMRNLSFEPIKAVGVFCDADNSAPATFDEFKENLSAQELPISPTWTSLGTPGTWHSNGEGVAVGIYIFPNNAGTGALETILMDTVERIDGKALPSAKTHVSVGSNHLTSAWEHWKKEKAILSAAGAVMVRPPRYASASNAVKIREANWIQRAGLGCPTLTDIVVFLATGLGEELS